MFKIINVDVQFKCALVGSAKRQERSYTRQGIMEVCNPGVKAMRATILEKALEKGFRTAGGVPVRQPSTYSLLGGLFSKEDLSSLFPGRLNKKEADERKKLALALLDIMATIPRGPVRTAKIGMLREEFPAPVRARRR